MAPCPANPYADGELERRHGIYFSTRFFVLSLGVRKTRLFEAFRDLLIDVENQGFPVEASDPASRSPGQGPLDELALTVDRCFGHYYALDPLGLVVVGDRELQSAFRGVTVHEAAIVGRIAGDHTATPVRDLGQIVWPAVREAMSGGLDQAMRDLAASGSKGTKASGLDAVSRLAGRGARATLLVEDDYRMRGSIGGTTEAPVLSADVDVRDSFDDVVDAVIEKVLAAGGNVVFAPSGSLSHEKRIVLLPHDAARVRAGAQVEEGPTW